MSKKKPLVSIVMGSESDLPSMSAASEVLKDFAVPFEIQIVSAHRTPKQMLKYAQEASARGLQVIIAGAGGAAHLPGMIASATTLPVIGVPVTIGKLQGLDALLSIAQMPKGVPVATMAVDNSHNAALFALRILGTTDGRIQTLLERHSVKQEKKVQAMNKRLKARS
jgi:phosphoribosylaminoimidazole carboxylase PurE protein